MNLEPTARRLPTTDIVPRTTLVLALLAFASCNQTDSEARAQGPRVYVALDQQFSRPLLDRFAQELRLAVDQRHDTEANKTVGLVNALLEERDRPRCSVFWNNELANTVMLAEKGVFEPYDSPSARDMPSVWRDPQRRWTGFAARARILIVNTDLLPDRASWPQSYLDLADPKWRGRCAVARPLTGTTLTHFAALHDLLGDDAFGNWLDALFANDVQFLQSNGATMRAVRDGQLAFAFTDTDDYHVARLRGFPVACVFPDQHDGGLGTMLIPNSVALVKGGPDPEGARRLIDRILARDTEALLAAADGAQIPLREGIPGPKDESIRAVGQFRQMAWNIGATAANLSPFQARYGKRFGL